MLKKFSRLIFLLIFIKTIQSENVLDENFIHDNQTVENDVRKQMENRMKSILNTDIDPCDDFFEYTCGNYWRLHPMDPEVSVSGTSSDISSNIENMLDQLFEHEEDENSDVNYENITAIAKARLFYRSCMEIDIFNYSKSEMYLNLIKEIGGFPILDPDWKPENFDWLKMVAEMAKYGINAFIGTTAPYEESSNVIPIIFAINAILGSDDIDFDNPYSKEYLQNKFFIIRLMDLYGVKYKQANKMFRDFIKFWRKLDVLYKNITLAYLLNNVDDSESNDTMTFDSLQERVPEIDWTKYFSGLFENTENITVDISDSKQKYCKQLSALISEMKPETVANYLAVKFLSELHIELSSRKNKQEFCLNLLNTNMLPVVNTIYVQKLSQERDQIENDVLNLGELVRNEFRKDLETTRWISQSAKTKLISKLNNITLSIGYSNVSNIDEILNKKYKDLKISNSTFYENYLNLLIFKKRSELKITSNESDDEDSVAEYNAYFLPSKNSVTIIPGMLTAPYYHLNYPKFINFGNIGSTFGHEITHGFDDDGIQHFFDSDDDDDDAWLPSNFMEKYRNRVKCMILQYNRYRVVEVNRHVRGSDTIGENIADNGGLRHSYNAYVNWLENNATKEMLANEQIPGLNFTNKQLFFVGYAQGYCEKHNRDSMFSVLGDVHTIERFRVIGPLSNFNNFAEEFNCPVGSKMNPRIKCRVW